MDMDLSARVLSAALILKNRREDLSNVGTMWRYAEWFGIFGYLCRKTTLRFKGRYDVELLASCWPCRENQRPHIGSVKFENNQTLLLHGAKQGISAGATL